jgi:hypothetical protein
MEDFKKQLNQEEDSDFGKEFNLEKDETPTEPEVNYDRPVYEEVSPVATTFAASDKKRKMGFPKFGLKRPGSHNRTPNHEIFDEKTKSAGGFSFKKKPLLITLGVVLLVLVGGFFVVSGSNKKGQVAGVQTDKRAEIPDAKARQNIGQNFDFPITDSTGKAVTKIHYSVENAELHDEIVVQGQPATAVKGKTFLVVNLKITNDYDKPIQLNTKDYVRLTRNGSEEQLAADIHNDPITIQPISTKFTRLGFAINDNDKNLQLHVGEISGTKSTIDLHF